MAGQSDTRPSTAVLAIPTGLAVFTAATVLLTIHVLGVAVIAAAIVFFGAFALTFLLDRFVLREPRDDPRPNP
ncbi:hypothetical protein [Microbacterium nymphoidis]|uniref:hypothetical protein n=1 Tax=Microbacterium nymphoidis TaxID=2898586 RepID=UPI001E3F9922|nr:hypothetical protein [Microbacterium nymphoidis]MCD2498622.1 hypothetical protein [Microbacterium nymphoidis]